MSLRGWLWTLVPSAPPPPPPPLPAAAEILGWLSTREPSVPATLVVVPQAIILITQVPTAGRSLRHRALKLLVRHLRPAAAVLFKEGGASFIFHFPVTPLSVKSEEAISLIWFWNKVAKSKTYVLPSVLRAFVRKLHLHKSRQTIVTIIAKPSNPRTGSAPLPLQPFHNNNNYKIYCTINNTELIQTTCLKIHDHQFETTKSNISPDKRVLHQAFNLCALFLLYLTNFM